MTNTRSSVHALALTGGLALVLAGGACGGSDDGGDATAGVATTPQQQELAAAYQKLNAAFAAGDGKAYCAGLTPATARAQGRLFKKSCEQLVRELANNENSSAAKGSSPPKIIKVEIAGDRGTVSYRQPGVAKPGATEFAYRGGRWLGDWRPVALYGKAAAKADRQ